MYDLEKIIARHKHPKNNKKSALLRHLKYGFFAFAMYLGAKNHDLILRVEDMVKYHSTPIEESYFSDPMGLKIRIQANRYGRKEVYLMHTESNQKLPICHDMLPPTDMMLEGLLNRVPQDSGLYNEIRACLERDDASCILPHSSPQLSPRQ